MQITQQILDYLRNIWNYLITASGYVALGIRIVVILIIVVIVERLVTRYMRRLGRRLELGPDITNGLVVTARFFVILGGVVALMEVGGLPSDWFVAFGALGGAAIGFASTRTIGNFMAGLYILASRPFHVNDYVIIKGIEGIVKEITINYTKILTADYKTVLISNQEVLSANIIRFSPKEGEYCYTLEASFDHSLTEKELEAIFDKVIEQFTEKTTKKPEYAMIGLNRLERKYRFFLYFKNPEDLFTVPSEFLAAITEAWDKARTTR